MNVGEQLSLRLSETTEEGLSCEPCAWESLLSGAAGNERLGPHYNDSEDESYEQYFVRKRADGYTAVTQKSRMGSTELQLPTDFSTTDEMENSEGKGLNIRGFS